MRNALGRATTHELKELFVQLADRSDVGAIIITGAGQKAFIAGADIRELRMRRRDDGLAGYGSELYSTIERCPKPVIAAVNGHAAGGGCELALACDLRIAASHATFCLPEARLGIIPAGGATQRLPRIVGLGRAMQMILTGDPIDARTAAAWGLVSQVVPAGRLRPVANALARRILEHGALSLRLAKLALHASARVDLDSGLTIERLAQAICFESEDKREGTEAFLQKRRPRFRNPREAGLGRSRSR